jgi:hypothetical protein
MSEITRADQLNAFELSVLIEVFQVEVPGRGPGIFRMDMQVGYNFHVSDLACHN